MVAFDAVPLLDVTGPLQVSATANEPAVKGSDALLYIVMNAARQTPSVTSSAGIALMTEELSHHAAPVDTLIVAGGPGVEGAQDEALFAWLAARRDDHLAAELAERLGHRAVDAGAAASDEDGVG